MRAFAIIDGFNYYHRLDDAVREGKETKNIKWVNYRSLIEGKLERDEKLEKIFYCSAYAHHRGEEAVARHRLFIKALQTTNIDIVWGNFKEKQPQFSASGK